MDNISEQTKAERVYFGTSHTSNILPSFDYNAYKNTSFVEQN